MDYQKRGTKILDMNKDSNSKTKNKKQDSGTKSKGMVTIPYVKELLESISRVFRKHHVSTAMRPQKALRNILVHPKDKQAKEDKAKVIYSIPCKNCDPSMWAKLIVSSGPD